MKIYGSQSKKTLKLPIMSLSLFCINFSKCAYNNSNPNLNQKLNFKSLSKKDLEIKTK